MKKILSVLLVLSIVLSMFVGCGGNGTAQEMEAAVETTAVPAAEPTTEPTTEPTLSPEEVLYNSLSDRTKQAVDAGIVELSQLEDLERIVTVGEASAMLQKAYVHRAGMESKMLNELMTAPEYTNETATLIWIAGVPGLADMELTHGEHYENYGQWRSYLIKETKMMSDLWWSFSWRLAAMDMVPGIAEDRKAFQYDENGDTFFGQYGIFYEGLFEELAWPDTPLYAYEVEDPSPYDYGRQVYDSTNGKKYYTMSENMDWLGGVTVAEAAECALVYYNFPNPMAYPTFVAPEEVGSFNPDIITADLLEKDTDLPTPSCEYLPKEWHGTVMDDMSLFERNSHLDDHVYEYEIQKVKEAGFNFVGMNLDFSWLQDYTLMDGQKECYVGFVRNEDVGKLSQERLEQLDRVVALCMKYDIHLNFRATDVGGRNNANKGPNISDGAYAPQLASMWQAIARRYAEIPNEYLSFTLFTSVSNQDATANNLMPSVQSIREVSPDRCIIADIYGWKMQKRDVIALAEAGVALSSRIQGPEEIFLHRNHYQYDGVRMNLTLKGKKVIDNFVWPYTGKIDASALLSMNQWRLSPEEVMTMAQEFGVGYMLSDFGITLDQFHVGMDNYVYPRYRYADDAYYAMIRDITSTMEEKGYGWCFAHWYGSYGVAFCIPVIQTSTYEQVEDYPYYIDQGMFGLFREINGVS